jgi:5-methylcytosine-specific restriction endonuclease McrA
MKKNFGLTVNNARRKAIRCLMENGVNLREVLGTRTPDNFCLAKLLNDGKTIITKRNASRILVELTMHLPAVASGRARHRTVKLLNAGGDFYSTQAWRELRFAALLKYGRKCMCCGREPKHGIVLHVDHIKPIALYPELALDPKNVQILCQDCNLGKSANYIVDFRPVP